MTRQKTVVMTGNVTCLVCGRRFRFDTGTLIPDHQSSGPDACPGSARPPAEAEAIAYVRGRQVER